MDTLLVNYILQGTGISAPQRVNQLGTLLIPSQTHTDKLLGGRINFGAAT